jgi:hypothetical protein
MVILDAYEPDAFNAHVWICGGPGWATTQVYPARNLVSPEPCPRNPRVEHGMSYCGEVGPADNGLRVPVLFLRDRLDSQRRCDRECRCVFFIDVVLDVSSQHGLGSRIEHGMSYCGEVGPAENALRVPVLFLYPHCCQRRRGGVGYFDYSTS